MLGNRSFTSDCDSQCLQCPMKPFFKNGSRNWTMEFKIFIKLSVLLVLLPWTGKKQNALDLVSRLKMLTSFLVKYSHLVDFLAIANRGRLCPRGFHRHRTLAFLLASIFVVWLLFFLIVRRIKIYFDLKFWNHKALMKK